MIQSNRHTEHVIANINMGHIFCFYWKIYRSLLLNGVLHNCVILLFRINYENVLCLIHNKKARCPVQSESSTREFRNYLWYLLPVSFEKKTYCISFFLVEFSFPISITINATIANDTTLSTDVTTMVSLFLHNMTAQKSDSFYCYIGNHEKWHWKKLMMLHKTNHLIYMWQSCIF